MLEASHEARGYALWLAAQLDLPESRRELPEERLEVARELPEDTLRLMGYSRGAYALGYVDDTRDPMDVVRPEAADDGLGGLESAQRRLRTQSG